jgi:hypothetical protein
MSNLVSLFCRFSVAATSGALLFQTLMHRNVEQAGETAVLRERTETYRGQFAGGNDPLRPGNDIQCEGNAGIAKTSPGATISKVGKHDSVGRKWCNR